MRISDWSSDVCSSDLSGFLFQNGFNILDAQQFDDVLTGRFFARMKFGAVDGAADLGTLRQKFAPIAQSFDMDWTIRSRSQPQRVLLLASKFDHCLADLLYRWRIGELAMEARKSTRLNSSH